MIFFTNSVKHMFEKYILDKKINKKPSEQIFGQFLQKKFKDGEIYTKVESNVENKQVWVISGTQAPCDSFLELFFLLDALTEAGAKINLLITYFAYARQDRANYGEALSSKVISNFLKTFNLNKILIVHPHSKLLKNYLKYNEIYFFKAFSLIAGKYDLLMAPDKGAAEFVSKIANLASKEVGFLTKFRPRQEQTETQDLTPKNLKITGGKVLIIDDMISTGSTVITAAEKLLNLGAKEIHVFATHGVFSLGIPKKMHRFIKKIYVTNTLPQAKNTQNENLEIIDISKEILQICDSML